MSIQPKKHMARPAEPSITDDLEYVVFVDQKLNVLSRFNNETHATIGGGVKVPVIFDEKIVRAILPCKIMVVTMEPVSKRILKSVVIEQCEQWPPHELLAVVKP